MNESLRLTAVFIRDLLTYDESLIKIGRSGSEITDFDTAYIAVDSLGAARRLAGGETFDGIAEVMKYQQQYLAPVTLSFYGSGAWSRATEFSLRIKSQNSIDLQQSLGISVYMASQITDVKILTGQQYGERYEIALNIQFSILLEVATLRIETQQINLITENGVEIAP